MAPRLQRAGVRNVQFRTLGRDAEPWLAELEGRMDRVLVDAPCSGSGAWRRNPAARWQLDRARLDVLSRRQGEIMALAARLVRPGGRLVYAVCSLLVAEAEDVVTAFLAARPEFRPLPVTEIWRGLGAAASPSREASPWLLLTPARHGTDGFFIAVLERDASPLVTAPATNI
jgi:16S rRNA (cytosine967-C5)-methyltransferase